MSRLEAIKVIARKLFIRKYGYFGDHKDWSSAHQLSGGYNAENILEKVKAATLQVQSGQAVYERDSVLFDKIEYSWPLLSALMWVAALNKGKLHVIDFGGSLGSSYFQNKMFLDSLAEVKWNILEQPLFVKCGQDLLQNKQIQFFYSIDEAIMKSGAVDVLLVACTLPYIEEPHALLKKLMEYEIPYIIIDNTPFNYEARDRITIQKVHPSIYDASYPCWLLNYENVIKLISEKYSVVSEHYNDSNIFVDGRKLRYRGFVAKIKS